MGPNPILKKLGFSDNDRLVIVHTDDIGMCQASLAAFADLLEVGNITSGAVMVPCPWFLAVAAFCREHPQADMGVHATLTSEWDLFRWGPVSSRDPRSGLLDGQGYFPRTTAAVQQQADAEAVGVELKAQVERALAEGIDVTHVDSHMGSVVDPKFFPHYLQAAAGHGLPALIPRSSARGLDLMDSSSQAAPEVKQFLDVIENQGLPMVDALASMPLDQPEGQLEIAKHRLASLPAGVTHFMLHPSLDTPELRAITPDWPSRVANYQTFMSPELKHFIKNEGLILIGYRALRDLLRG